MSITPYEWTLKDSARAMTPAEMGLREGNYVQEIGYDDDVDFDLREAIEAAIGEEMSDEDVNDVFDAIIMWWRADDPDLTDGLVDALSTLDAGGVIWLLTPKAKRPGHITPADISLAAPIAGMHVTKTESAGADWSASRLVPKKNNA